MASYNVMITQANSKLGYMFVRQLLSLPNPPEYIFAVYTEEKNLKDLISIQESSKFSKVIVCEMDMKPPIEDGIGDVKNLIEQIVGNKGLDLLMNIICLTNVENDLITPVSLENQFQASTLTSLMLYQMMVPLLEAAALRNTEYNPKSKAVFFNITEDDSSGFNPVSEVNKVALNLAMNVMVEKVKKNNILTLGTCLSLKQNDDDDDTHEIKLEKCVASNLLYVLCSSQSRKLADLDNCIVCQL